MATKRAKVTRVKVARKVRKVTKPQVKVENVTRRMSVMSHRKGMRALVTIEVGGTGAMKFSEELVDSLRSYGRVVTVIGEQPPEVIHGWCEGGS